MNEPLPQKEQAIWQRLVEIYLMSSQALKEFFSEDVDRVSLMQKALRRGNPDRATALYITRYMETSELQQLFDELVRLSTAPGYAGRVREIILSLPREWVLSNIERTVDPILQQDATENEYRRILELYLELEAPQLMDSLAQRAIKHPDEDIREAGEDFLDALASNI